MSYVQEVLQPGEEIRYVASIHWVTYLHGMVWLLGALIVWTATPLAGPVATLTGLALFCVGAFFLARAWFNRWITEIAVTNRRVIYKKGFISRTTAEMHMDKIESVKVDQSLLGRILDYGKVTVLGTGTGTESLGQLDEPIASPLQLRNHITGV
jgi:uncharacterized membrane protein YdbT with pleckstrin-like domain